MACIKVKYHNCYSNTTTCHNFFIIFVSKFHSHNAVQEVVAVVPTITVGEAYLKQPIVESLAVEVAKT